MYRNLDAWKKSYSLGLEIYKITKKFPKEELFGMTSQLRRATTSISVNIAEGNSRNSNKDFARFLSISRGSASEVEVWLSFARDLNYITIDEFDFLQKQIDDVKALLFGLQKSLK